MKYFFDKIKAELIICEGKALLKQYPFLKSFFIFFFFLNIPFYVFTSFRIPVGGEFRSSPPTNHHSFS